MRTYEACGCLFQTAQGAAQCVVGEYITAQNNNDREFILKYCDMDAQDVLVEMRGNDATIQQDWRLSDSEWRQAIREEQAALRKIILKGG